MGSPICKACFDKAPAEDKAGIDPNYRYGLFTSCVVCGVYGNNICVPIVKSKNNDPLKTFQEESNGL